MLARYRARLRANPLEEFSFKRLVSLYKKHSSMARLVREYSGARSSTDLIVLGRLQASMGQHEEALEHFEQSASLTPEYLMARYHIGVIHERLGNFEEAKQAFHRSMDEGVRECSSLFHLAEIARMEGDPARADELVRKAREIGCRSGLKD